MKALILSVSTGQGHHATGKAVADCFESMGVEGEMLDAIHRPLGAKSLDGVKRRTRAGMGRCQAGFRSPKVMEILERELQRDMEQITKSGGTSTIEVSRTKEGKTCNPMI